METESQNRTEVLGFAIPGAATTPTGRIWMYEGSRTLRIVLTTSCPRKLCTAALIIQTFWWGREDSNLQTAAI